MKLASGHVAVVTGAASGIGFALAEALCERGLTVMLADVEGGPLEETASLIAAVGFNVKWQRTDVADPAAMRSLAEATAATFGHVDLLVNNAGVGGPIGPVWAGDLTDWTWVVGVNLFGVVNGLQAFLPAMLKRGQGHVVNIASIAGLTSSSFMAPYAASKHAVVALSESLATELACVDSPIKVSVACPGLVDTRIIESERNRPAHLQAPLRPSPQNHPRIKWDILDRVASDPLPATAVAAKVIAGVEQDDFYILTHPENNQQILNRLTTVDAAMRRPGATASS